MLSWVNLQVPDGPDYIEFMLYDQYPSADRIRTMQHICLEVPDVTETEATLMKRVLPPGSKAPGAMKVGVNGKRQLNYFDPDGTRVEVMEPVTFDGKVRAPSEAPAPVGQKKSASLVN